MLTHNITTHNVGGGWEPPAAHCFSNQIPEDWAAQVMGGSVLSVTLRNWPSSKSITSARGATAKDARKKDLFVHTMGSGPGVQQGFENAHGEVRFKRSAETGDVLAQVNL